MTPLPDRKPGRCRWIDLAASDAGHAQSFYAALFGWTARTEKANGGVFTCLQLGDEELGSIYQLKRAQLEAGVPSHWTPYVEVDDVERAARQVMTIGGEVLVRPLRIAGRARIAVIVDPVGAPLGLWQPLGPGDRHG